MNSIKHIPINQLRPHPDNTKFFHDIEGEEWDCFKADIAEHGILQPILVSAEDEDCTVLSGHQRLRAARVLGWESVPCIIWDAMLLTRISSSAPIWAGTSHFWKDIASLSTF